MTVWIYESFFETTIKNMTKSLKTPRVLRTKNVCEYYNRHYSTVVFIYVHTNIVYNKNVPCWAASSGPASFLRCSIRIQQMRAIRTATHIITSSIFDTTSVNCTISNLLHNWNTNYNKSYHLEQYWCNATWRTNSVYLFRFDPTFPRMISTLPPF